MIRSGFKTRSKPMARGTADMARTTSSPAKLRKCAVVGCRTRFSQRSMTHRACGPDCAALLAKGDREKAERRDMAARKEKIKTRSDHLKAAQVAFNAFIRERDKNQPCICCGRPLKSHDTLHGHNVDAGHYRSTGSAPHMRFDERNCHAQLVNCNRYGAGRAVDYRIGLIKRIGQAAVDEVEADQTIRKWSVEELISIKALYRAKLKALQGSKP